MQVESIAECSLGAFCKTCPAWSINLSWKPIFGLFWGGCLRQVFFVTVCDFFARRVLLPFVWISTCTHFLQTLHWLRVWRSLQMTSQQRRQSPALWKRQQLVSSIVTQEAESGSDLCRGSSWNSTQRLLHTLFGSSLKNKWHIRDQKIFSFYYIL